MKILNEKIVGSNGSNRKMPFYFWLVIAVIQICTIVLINTLTVLSYARADTFDFGELKPYASVAVGYEFDTEYGTMGDGSEYKDPISANFEVGVEKDKCFNNVRIQCSFGLAHDSHYRTGFPFNGAPEPKTNRLFYKVKYYF